MENGTFNSQTWKKILNEMNVGAKRNFNLKQLKQKFHRLRAKYCEFSDLLKHTGFVWDVESNMVHALEETWKNYIRVNDFQSNHSLVQLFFINTMLSFRFFYLLLFVYFILGTPK